MALNNKCILIITVLVLGILIALPVSTVFAEDNTGPQTWSLNSKLIKSPSVYEMNKNYGPTDFGQSGQVSLNYLQKKYWVSDQKTQVDLTFPSGVWMLQMRTDSDWGIQGSQCKMEVGEWNGTAFNSLTPAPQNITSTYNADTKYLVIRLNQSASITMLKNNYMAIKITNVDIDSHIIHTGEGIYNSFLRSPETGSNFVVLPEIPAGFLLGIGLTGLIGLIYIKRKSWIKHNN
jgi:hypothetical protein